MKSIGLLKVWFKAIYKHFAKLNFHKLVWQVVQTIFDEMLLINQKQEDDNQQQQHNKKKHEKYMVNAVASMILNESLW